MSDIYSDMEEKMCEVISEHGQCEASIMNCQECLLKYVKELVVINKSK